MPSQNSALPMNPTTRAIGSSANSTPEPAAIARRAASSVPVNKNPPTQASAGVTGFLGRSRMRGMLRTARAAWGFTSRAGPGARPNGLRRVAKVDRPSREILEGHGPGPQDDAGPSW